MTLILKWCSQQSHKASGDLIPLQDCSITNRDTPLSSVFIVNERGPPAARFNGALRYDLALYAARYALIYLLPVDSALSLEKRVESICVYGKMMWSTYSSAVIAVHVRNAILNFPCRIVVVWVVNYFEYIIRYFMFLLLD